MIKIITDSTSDVSLEKAKEKNISVVPLKVMFQTESYADGVDLKTEDFYKKLVSSTTLPTTSQPSPEEFVRLFEEVKEKQEEAIVILLSSTLSGTVQSAMIAKELVDYDKIHIIDSVNATIGLSILVDEAIKLRDSGKDAQTIINHINTLIPKIRIIALVDTLEYFVKGGRLSKTAGIAGKVLQLKPIVVLEEGHVKVISKAMGTKKATRWMINYIKTESDYQVDPSYPLYFGYTGEPVLLEEYITMMQNNLALEHYPYQTIIIGTVIGTHAGPGAKAFAYVAK